MRADELMRVLGRMEGTLEGISEKVDSVVATSKVNRKDIDDLKAFRSRVRGAAVAIGSVFTGVVAIIAKFKLGG